MIRPFERTTLRVALPIALLVGLVALCWLIAPKSHPAENFQAAGLLVDSPLVPTPIAQQDSTSATDAEKRYQQALTKGRDLAKECRVISVNFFDSSLAKSYEWKDKWPAAAKALSDHKPVLEEASLAWFFECENPPGELLQLVSAISGESYDSGDMELTWRILNKVKKFYPEPNDIILNRRMALVAIKSNRYKFAMEFMKMPGAKEAVEKLESQLEKNMFLFCSLKDRQWDQEMEIRKNEAEVDDLPQVKFQLSTGDVVIELFENEAPQTVANFISLVESGYYDDAIFHPVVKDIVVQTGMFNRSHNIPVDYLIKNESRAPNARKHFVGSLSMASSEGGKDSASTLFAITLVPNPDLDWDGKKDDAISQPVFGRIVSGMEIIAGVPVTVEVDPETEESKTLKDVTPGVIEKATVIRKRDHDYTFEKIRRSEQK